MGAFRRAGAVRALGAPRAHVLHARALRRHAALPHATRPDPGPLCIAEPCTSRPCSTISLAPCCAAGRALGGTPASAAASAMFGTAQTAPARQLPLGIARAYPPTCRNAFVAATMPCNYSNGDSSSILSTAAEPASSRYIREPRAPPSTHATSDFPRRASCVVNRPVVAVSLNSGQLGRRQAPVRFVATGHPLAQPAPPEAFP